MPGKTGKRSKAPAPCRECGQKIEGNFNRNRDGDRHPECWYKWYERQKEEVEKAKVRLLDEAVRLHYLSLEGGGPDVFEEALFFLEWHYDNGSHMEGFS